MPNSDPRKIITPLVLVGLGLGVGEGLGLGVGLGLGNQVAISTRGGGNNLAGSRKWAQHRFIQLLPAVLMTDHVR